jgi:hypothetical protein
VSLLAIVWNIVNTVVNLKHDLKIPVSIAVAALTPWEFWHRLDRLAPTGSSSSTASISRTSISGP